MLSCTLKTFFRQLQIRFLHFKTMSRTAYTSGECFIIYEISYLTYYENVLCYVGTCRQLSRLKCHTYMGTSTLVYMYICTHISTYMQVKHLRAGFSQCASL
jgi:hypothetical protein